MPVGIDPAFNWNPGKVAANAAAQKLVQSQQNYQAAAAAKPKKEYLTKNKLEADIAALYTQIKNTKNKKTLAELEAKKAATAGQAPKPKTPPPRQTTATGGETIEQRFGKKFDAFLKKSFDFVDRIETLPDNVKKEIESRLYARGKKMTVDDFFKEVNDFIKQGTLVRYEEIDTFLKNIDDFEKNPRMKTQFETGTSMASLNPEDRNFWERKIIGKASNYGWNPNDIDKTNYGISDRQRPVYGEITKFKPNEGNAHGNYGDISFVMNSRVRERTSFTLENSSCEGVGSFKSNVASVFAKPEIDAGFNVDSFYGAQKKGGNYIEIQIWGGVDLSKGDVEAVVMDDKVFADKKNDPAFQRFLRVLNDNGVSVIKTSEWGKRSP